MPKITAPETYDQWVVKAVLDAARDVGKTQADVAGALGVSERTLTRRRNDGPGFSVNELTRAAGVLGISAGDVLESALSKYGGIGKLLSEGRAKNHSADDDAIPDNVTVLSRRESAELDQEGIAAHHGDAEEAQPAPADQAEEGPEEEH